MTLKERVTEDMKAAMRAKETARLGAIRLLLAAIKQKEVDERITVDDAMVISIIDKMLKQRRDSIAQFEAAGRTDLVDAEKLEADLLASYMPAGLSADEILAAVVAAVSVTGAAGPGDMGKVMAELKARHGSELDMSKASALVKAALA